MHLLRHTEKTSFSPIFDALKLSACGTRFGIILSQKSESHMQDPTDKGCVIIAEAGVNHNGSIETAKEMIRAAAEAGADYVKFQTFSAAELVTRAAKQAEYQKRNLRSGNDDSQYSMLKKLELSRQDHFELRATCKECGIRFLSTAFDNDSLLFLSSDLGIDRVKIPSGELTNLPYLRLAATLGKPVIISTGMATLDEIVDAVDVLLKSGMGKQDICILHCTTEYPTPYSEVNLRAMDAIAKATECKVGYSDHTTGIDVAIAAAARGAAIVEKHFTLNRSLPGPDHQASVEPYELKRMVKAIRNVELALGEEIKRPVSACELANREVVRKSIVAACRIKGGEVLTESNLATKRPGTGLSPMLWDSVLGKTAKRDFAKDDMIEL